MKTFQSYISIVPFSLMLALSCKDVKAPENKVNRTDTITKSAVTVQKTDKHDTLDIMLAQTDTSTPEGKRQLIKLRFLKKLDPSGFNYDTLIDLNYDGHPDYMIALYAQAGTGIKNGIEVYLFQPDKKNYRYNEMLSGIRNPSFYLKEKKITGFYLANGAGGGEMYQFIRGEWTITREFYVDNQGDSSVWEIFYPKTNTMKKIIRPYAMVPPADILPTSYPEW